MVKLQGRHCRLKILALLVCLSLVMIPGLAYGLDVQCTTDPLEDPHGADLGGRFVFTADASGETLQALVSEVLVLDREGNIIDVLPIDSGDKVQVRLRDVVKIKSDLGRLRWMIAAPGVLFRSRAIGLYGVKVAYCSPFAAIRLDYPENLVFSSSAMSEEAPVHLTVGVACMEPSSIMIEVDCVDIIAVVGASLPGGPFAGSAIIEGSDVTIESLTHDHVRGTISFTILGLPGGSHKVRVSGSPVYANDVPFEHLNFHRPLGALINEREIHIFRAMIGSPTDGQALEGGPVWITGTVTHGQPIEKLRLHGTEVPLGTIEHIPGDECIGDVYRLEFEYLVDLANLQVDLQSGSGELSALDPGVNYVSIIATDIPGNASGDRVRFTVGPVAQPANLATEDEPRLDYLMQIPAFFVPDAIVASLGDKVLDRIIDLFVLDFDLGTLLRAYLNGLEGEELSKVLAYDPCDPSEQTPIPCDPPVAPVDPPSDPETFSITFNVVGDNSVVKTEMMQMTLGARDYLHPGTTYTYEMYGAPPGAELVGNQFGWVPCCEQIGSWTVTFVARGPQGYRSAVKTVTSSDGLTDRELPIDVRIGSTAWNQNDLNSETAALTIEGADKVRTYIETGEMHFNFTAHKCLLYWGWCWLEVEIPIHAPFHNLRINSDLTPEQAVFGLGGSSPEFSLDGEATQLGTVVVDFPTFDGFFGWLVNALTLPFAIAWNEFHIEGTFLIEHFYDPLNQMVANMMEAFCGDNSCFPSQALTIDENVDAGSQLALTILPSSHPTITPGNSLDYGALNLGFHTQFQHTVQSDLPPVWVPTPSGYSNAVVEQADAVIHINDDALNQMFSSLSATGSLQGTFSGFTLGDLTGVLNSETAAQLAYSGMSESTPLLLSVDLAQSPQGNPIPPLVGFVDNPATAPVEMIVRVQVLVRAIWQRGQMLTDDRSLCLCNDLRPECFDQPCLAFEDVLKLNLHTSCLLTGDPPSSSCLDFQVTSIQQLARGAGFAAGEIVDLSDNEESIVATSATSPLLAQVRDRLNGRLPSLNIPQSALTLNGYIWPTNLRLFATQLDGTRHGVQDYLGIAFDMVRSPSPAARRTSDATSAPGEKPRSTAEDKSDNKDSDDLDQDPADLGPPTAAGSVSLDQNYPNPFNPLTEIAFSLNEHSVVELEVFNVLGQRVETLHSGALKAGKHVFMWDGTLVSSGIYFYRLSVGNEVHSLKMLLLK